ASRITYSFAPDGTNIGGVPSTLNAAMASQGITTAVWQQQFQRAAATWAAVTGFNIVEVSDDGTAYNAPGNQQSDPRFGDIRIGGIGMAPGGLAATFSTPPFNGGTIAGDMVFNTNQSWKINSNDMYNADLLTVAVHEFGHALGMDHSAVTTADMYAYYTGMKQKLTADDTAGIKSIYGTRQPDAFDASGSNGSTGTASNITSYLNGLGQISLPNLDITTASDYDWYYVVAPPDTTGTMTVTIQSSGLSSLGPSLTLLNSSMTSWAVASSTNYGDTVTASFSGVKAGQGFYIKAMSTTVGPQGVGAYGLQVNFGSSPMDPIAPPVTIVPEQPNQRGGGTSNLVMGTGTKSSPQASIVSPLQATISLGGQTSPATGQVQTSWGTDGTARATGSVTIKGLGERALSGDLRLTTSAPGSLPGADSGGLNLQIGGRTVNPGARRVAGVVEIEGLGPRSASGSIDANGRLSLNLGVIEQLSLGNLSAWGEITSVDDLFASSPVNTASAIRPAGLDLFQGIGRITDAPTLKALEVALADWQTDLTPVWQRDRNPR
ncbi:MAG: matrixin family metalloprotease, partial [Isosphaeraceae bacterium]